MSLPTGSKIRASSHTLLVEKDGSLRTLREGDRTWKGNTLAPWASLDTFLETVGPAWWEAAIEYPKGYFDEAWRLRQDFLNRLNGPEFAHLTQEQRWAQASQSHNDIFQKAHSKFRTEIVEPFKAKYGLMRAVDHQGTDYTYGTAGSPVSKTAAQRLCEVEPDPAKWTTFWKSVVDEKQQKMYRQLMYRHLWRGPEARAAEVAVGV
jgi:hypothetical protein